jgi:hypothetical protein
LSIVVDRRLGLGQVEQVVGAARPGGVDLADVDLGAERCEMFGAAGEVGIEIVGDVLDILAERFGVGGLAGMQGYQLFVAVGPNSDQDQHARLGLIQPDL